MMQSSFSDHVLDAIDLHVFMYGSNLAPNNRGLLTEQQYQDAILKRDLSNKFQRGYRSVLPHVGMVSVR